MTKEEIAEFGYEITTTDERTEIIFNDGKRIIGYFDGNKPHSEYYMENKWIFIETPIMNPDKKENIFNGNDFKSIRIFKV